MNTSEANKINLELKKALIALTSKGDRNE